MPNFKIVRSPRSGPPNNSTTTPSAQPPKMDTPSTPSETKQKQQQRALRALAQSSTPIPATAAMKTRTKRSAASSSHARAWTLVASPKASSSDSKSGVQEAEPKSSTEAQADSKKGDGAAGQVACASAADDDLEWEAIDGQRVRHDMQKDGEAREVDEYDFVKDEDDVLIVT